MSEENIAEQLFTIPSVGYKYIPHNHKCVLTKFPVSAISPYKLGSLKTKEMRRSGV